MARHFEWYLNYMWWGGFEYERQGLLAISLVCAMVLGACSAQPAVPVSYGGSSSDIETRVVSNELPLVTVAEGSHFGASVAAHGGMVVVGAWGDASFGRNSGAAYLFMREHDRWVLEAKLVASDAHEGARFGHSVAIDRGVVVVGALYNGNRAFRAGSAYVFEQIEDEWVETERLQPDQNEANAFFGSSVAIHFDTIVVGASGPGARAAYLFEHTGSGWTLSASVAPDAPEAGIRFGSSVDVHDGLAIVGAWVSDVAVDDASVLPKSGSVYVLERQNGLWSESLQLTPPDAEGVPLFGYAVSTDGATIVVGAPDVQQEAWIFRRNGSVWRLEHELGQVVEPDELFGLSVAVEGGRVAVGAPGHNGHAGATYVFDRGPTGVVSVTRLVPESPWRGVELGLSVALDAGTLFMGAAGTTEERVAIGDVYTLE